MRAASALTCVLLTACFATAGTLYIKAGRVFDGNGMLGSRVIVVRDSLIEAVLPDTVAVPSGAPTMDAADQTVLPGFVGSRFHFAVPALPGVDDRERYGPGRWEAEVASGFPRARLEFLRNGVTGVVDMDSALAAYPDFRRALAERRVVGPELHLSEVEKETWDSDQTAGGVFAKMAAFEAAGGSRVAALAAVTSVAAELLGRDREVGIVAPGARANLVFVNGAADTGVLSVVRVKRVILRGETVIEAGEPVRQYARSFRENSLSFFGYPYWDPLLSYLLGASVTDYDFLHSGVMVGADVLFSFRNMWSTNLVLAPPSPIPRTALRAGIHFDNQNRLFYGIGNHAPLSDPVEHTTLSFREWITGTTRLTAQWKVMTGVMLDQTRVGDFEGQSLPDTLPGRCGRSMAVLALALAHDGRDHQVNLRSGHYVSAAIQYSPGGFEKLVLDARGYFSPVHRHILAGRLLYQQAFGDVPFYYLPEFGGDTLGRGFLPFRFRDRAALIGQFEYRFPVWSFISGAAFADLGQFRGSPAEFTFAGFHPGFGLGPRFNFGPNESSMLGIDFGLTPEGWNIALHSGQAF